MAVRLEMIMAVPFDLLIALNEAEHAVPVQSLLCAVSNSAKNFAAVQKALRIFSAANLRQSKDRLRQDR
jgi:hypothetical protein